jgi:pimeloyl-ACP methyl ester carboxylesterase
MKALDCPVTFYLGRYDQVLTLKALKKLIGSLRNFSLHVLPAGHGSLPGKVEKILGEQSGWVFQHERTYEAVREC